jgi:hypothetical protein
VQTTADIGSGADAGEGDDHLEEAAHEHASVWEPELKIQSRWSFTEE